MSRQPPKPPASDSKENSRNEYIPTFIAQKPFYAADLLADTEYLSHQRSQTAEKTAQNSIAQAKWYSRSKTGPAATKYRKGACENCGAMTHKTKECLSRPRKQGAKWTGRDIQADEIVDEVRLGWDAKRDRWNGYDAREYDAVVKDFDDMEALRKAAAGSKSPGADGEDAEENGDEIKDIDEDMNLLKSQPTSTRQLRLREDTAKYLIDLDLDSAKYDPKTRSMDTTALALNNASGATDLASEGFVRPSHDPKSDAAAFERAQNFAWEAQGGRPPPPSEANGKAVEQQLPKGDSKVHLEANPTASSLAHRKHEEAMAAKQEQQKSYLLARYGDQSTHATAPKSKAIATTSSSAYIEYNPETGKPKDFVKTVAKSKYPEDVYPGNHSSVFGSFWRDGKWGYQCCHSFVKNSYCTGEEGKRGFEEEEAQRLGRNLITLAGEVDQQDTTEENSEEVSRKRKADVNGEGSTDLDSSDTREKRARTEDAG